MGPRSQCPICQRRDNMQMVACDGSCNLWHHVQCVGLTMEEAQALPMWICARCKPYTQASRSDAFKAGLDFEFCASSTLVPEATVAVEKMLHVSGRQNSNMYPQALHLQRSEALASNMKTLALNNADHGTAKTVRGSTKSNSSTRSLLLLEKKAAIEKQRQLLQRKQDLLTEEEELSRQEQRLIDEALSECKSQSSRGSQSLQTVKDNLPVPPASFYTFEAGNGKAGYARLSSVPKAAHTMFNPSHLQKRFVEEQREQHLYPEAAELITPQERRKSSQNDIQVPLSLFQWAERQSMEKRFPTFSGKPSEWPMFRSAYDHAVAAGVSDANILARLRACLKDVALTMVEKQLYDPTNVHGVVESLQMLFGRPEQLIEDEIESLRRRPHVKEDKLETIIELAVATKSLCATLKSAKLQKHLDNPMLVKELVSKLTSSLKLQWADHIGDSFEDDLVTFDDWIQQVARRACRVTPRLDLTRLSKEKSQPDARTKTRVNVHTVDEKPALGEEFKCPACSKECKSLASCGMFGTSSHEEKWKILRTNGICKQCLQKHKLKPPYNCPSAIKCSKENCKGKHHSLMHRGDQTVSKKSSPSTSTTTKNDVQVVTNCSHSAANETDFQFRYLPVVLTNGEQSIKVIAFFDEGSNSSFIEERLAESLGLSGPRSTLCLKFTGESGRTELSSMKTSVDISGTYKDASQFKLNDVRTVKSLNLPRQNLQYENLAQRFSYMRGIPVESYINAEPQLLIGLNNWYVAVPTKVRMGGEKEPIAAKCKLGWAILSQTGPTSHLNVNFCCHSQMISRDDEMINLIKYYYSIESLGVVVPKDDLASKEERNAMEIMRTTTMRVGDRYSTGLLWKYVPKDLPDSRPMALKRLYCLQRRMSRDPYLAEAMHKQIDNYFIKGYARRLTDSEIVAPTGKKWYLPIFPVKNPNKPKKTRLVFDAASEINGVSFNTMMSKGPDQVPSLVGIMLKFRLRKVAICGDIREMFHQIMVNPDDQHMQRFLWQFENEEKVVDCVLSVLTFGSSCSPASAQYVKNLNANEWIDEHPRAVFAIINNTYVDDWLDSFDDHEEAIRVIKTVKNIHKRGGFEIRGWKSNNLEVLRAMNVKESTDTVDVNIDLDEIGDKVLGMWWRPSEDCFTFKLNCNSDNEDVLKGLRPPTKREMLRIIMSVYDPMGLVAHFLAFVKVLMQDVTRSKVQWDEAIEPHHFESWSKWIDALPTITDVQIPRCLLGSIDKWQDINVQLHVFADSSENIAAAVAYFRLQLGKKVVCQLVMSKTKVAPLRKITIPRLELVAAVLGARLSKSIRTGIGTKIDKVVHWSDSQTVLCWLRSDTKKIKGQFVSFRVAEVQDITEIPSWRYVPSRANVADDATKWPTLLRLNMEDRWFQGPPFLYGPECEFPEDSTLAKHTTEEMKTVLFHQYQPSLFEYNRFSKFSRLLRSVAYVQRAKKKFLCVRKDASGVRNAPKGVLTVEELREAKGFLFTIAQAESYPGEIAILTNSSTKVKTIPTSSEIYHLSPYLDERKILRMHGRIDEADCVKFETKRPIILHRNHPVTKLIVREFHENYYHMNHETVINEIRQQYKISRLRQLLKEIRRNCNKCKYLMAKPAAPKMAALPKCRLSPYTHPFTFVGIDCLGPFGVAIGRRQEKRWILLFTCLTVRAVHLEILHGMDHDSFILAFRCFAARRGDPTDVYCDNGSNFVKGDKILREELQRVDMYGIGEKFTHKGIKFHFNPPESPHMGGSWERLVRSTKTALYSIQTTRTPSEQLFRSYIMEVESIINQRPLTYLPLDSEHCEALTPNHFIRGSSGGNKPIGVFDDDQRILKSNWLTSQRYIQRFWKRWVNEYLPDLTRRSKWFENVEPLKENDLVLLVDPQSKRNLWERGRILETHVGSDGQVRSAVVRTATRVVTRPAIKIAKLDIVSSELNCEQPGQRTEEKNVVDVSFFLSSSSSRSCEKRSEKP